MIKRLRRWVLKKLVKQVRNLEDDPTFGFFTTASPRDGQPDVQLSETVGKMLAGDLIPGKRMVRLEVVAHYSDGTVQHLFNTTEPHGVTSYRDDAGTHYDFTPRVMPLKARA